MQCRYVYCSNATEAVIDAVTEKEHSYGKLLQGAGHISQKKDKPRKKLIIGIKWCLYTVCEEQQKNYFIEKNLKLFQIIKTSPYIIQDV